MSLDGRKISGSLIAICITWLPSVRPDPLSSLEKLGRLCHQEKFAVRSAPYFLHKCRLAGQLLDRTLAGQLDSRSLDGPTKGSHIAAYSEGPVAVGSQQMQAVQALRLRSSWQSHRRIPRPIEADGHSIIGHD